MGQLERSGRRKDLSGLVLQTIGLAGLLGVFVVAPNVIGAMSKLGIIESKRQKESINQARDRLLKRGFLARQKGYLRLTEKGKLKLQLLQARDRKHGRQRWDRKWRVLIFDIPEYRKHARDKIRRTLEAIGFMRLQDSVWVFPHDCEDLVALLKADFRIGKDMLYMVVQELEGDQRIKAHFGIQ